MKNQLPEGFVKGRQTVCVQGLGFVGAAMALAVADARDASNQPVFNVIGIDLPNDAGFKKVESINSGIFPFENIDKKLAAAQESAFKAKNLWATTDSDYFSFADIVLSDINLDVKYENGEPCLDLSAYKKAMEVVGSKISSETLVIVETTVPPGTCEKVVTPILECEFEKRGLLKSDVKVAHSYERVMPGENYFDSIVNYWRVYSGISEKAADKCRDFLEKVINVAEYPLTRLETTTASETSKVLENSYRAMTIAFIEEWGRFAEAVGFDIYEVLKAIRKRPTHTNIRQPGFGVGGYCLTKDPYFAPLAAKDIFNLEGMDFPFSTQAVRVNNAMPIVSLDKVQTLLGGSLERKKLLILGISYRQDVGDTRYSPTEIFAREALKRGASIECHDPLVSYWEEMNLRVDKEIPSAEGFDAIVFTVPHKQYIDLNVADWIGDRDILVFDANCVLGKSQRQSLATLNCTFASIGRG